MGVPMVGKGHRRKIHSQEDGIGDASEYPTEVAQDAADALR
jgi:hypothetical protein